MAWQGMAWSAARCGRLLCRCIDTPRTLHALGRRVVVDIDIDDGSCLVSFEFEFFDLLETLLHVLA